MAQSICESEHLDEVWFLVSPQNPFKANMTLFDDTKRLELVKLAVAGDSRLFASDFEFHLARPSYTFHTLEALRIAYPDRQFELIIGADNWVSFPNWYRHDEIVAQTPVLVYPRPGYALDASQLPSGIKLVEAPLFPYSSTEVRLAIQAGKDASDMLPASVWEKIKTEHWYE